MRTGYLVSAVVRRSEVVGNEPAQTGNTIGSWVLNLYGHYDYREAVSVWFRGVFTFQLHPELMAAAPFSFQAHGMAAMLLFALWPFTRLVHVFSALLGYLTRPYIVYRSRDDQLGSRAPRRGWEKVR